MICELRGSSSVVVRIEAEEKEREEREEEDGGWLERFFFTVYYDQYKLRIFSFRRYK